MKTGYGFSHYALGLAVRLHPCQSQHLPNTSCWSSGTKYRQELVPPANISQICQSHFWSATQDKLISPNPATARECAFLPPRTGCISQNIYPTIRIPLYTENKNKRDPLQNSPSIQVSEVQRLGREQVSGEDQAFQLPCNVHEGLCPERLDEGLGDARRYAGCDNMLCAAQLQGKGLGVILDEPGDDSGYRNGTPKGCYYR